MVFIIIGLLWLGALNPLIAFSMDDSDLYQSLCFRGNLQRAFLLYNFLRNVQ